jgi:hypothetical protein
MLLPVLIFPRSFWNNLRFIEKRHPVMQNGYFAAILCPVYLVSANVIGDFIGGNFSVLLPKVYTQYGVDP